MSTSTIAAGLLAALVVYVYTAHSKLAHIPTVGGPSWPLLSYIGAVRYFKHASEMYAQGSQRYRVFKVALMDRWLVIVTGRQLTGELATLPDDVVSFDAATNQLIEGDFTFGPEILGDPWHVGTFKRNMTKNLSALFPAINDEVAEAFAEYIPVTDDWTAVPAMDVAMRVIARASNRAFTGRVLCRDQRFLDLNIDFTLQVVVSGAAIGLFPKFLKPLVGRYLTPVPKVIREATAILAPEIARRRKAIQQLGRDYPDKPNDCLTWMMDDAEGNPARDNDRDLSLRIMGLNFGAIHTSSNTFTHALYTLAAHPEWTQVIRQEIDAVIEAHGLSKESMVKMHKLDSFLRESTRMHSFVGQALTRMAMKPFTFSDGTFVPQGTILVAPTLPPHRDGGAFPAPDAFDPFRFEEPPAADSARKQFTTTDLSYLAFGHGKHACPGRFFAGNEIKAMLVYLLTRYDFRTEVEGVRPKDSFMGPTALPDTKAKVLFRKRQY